MKEDRFVLTLRRTFYEFESEKYNALEFLYNKIIFEPKSLFIRIGKEIGLSQINEKENIMAFADFKNKYLTKKDIFEFNKGETIVLYLGTMYDNKFTDLTSETDSKIEGFKIELGYRLYSSI